MGCAAPRCTAGRPGPVVPGLWRFALANGDQSSKVTTYGLPGTSEVNSWTGSLASLAPEVTCYGTGSELFPQRPIDGHHAGRFHGVLPALSGAALSIIDVMQACT